MTNTIKVGQKVWLVLDKRSEPQECTVSKVGRLYFELNEWSGKFSVDTLRFKSEFSIDRRCYLSLQDIRDEVNREKYLSQIRRFFSGWNVVDLTLSQLKDIVNIIESEKNA